MEPLIEPGAGVVLPVLPDVPLPSVDALLLAVGDGVDAALLPVEPLPVEPLLFFWSLPEELPAVEDRPELPLPVELLFALPPVVLLPVVLLPMLPLPVDPVPDVLLPILPAGLEALPILLPVEPPPVVLLTVEPPVELLPVEPDVGPVLLPGIFLLVSTMMISFKKSTIKHPERMRFKGEPVLPAANLWTSRVSALATC